MVRFAGRVNYSLPTQGASCFIHPYQMSTGVNSDRPGPTQKGYPVREYKFSALIPLSEGDFPPIELKRSLVL